jgi:hypothetical protein
MSSRSIRKPVVVCFVILCICFIPFAPNQDGAKAAVSSIEGTAIAYVSSSTDNQAIRMVDPDGANDRALWSLPEATHPVDGIGTLSWHPNGTELLFDSGHDWQRSMGIRDLYTVAPDGSALRRINRPPGPERYGNYPTGTVTFKVDAIEQGDVQIYIEGASAPVSYFAKLGYTYQITQTVADYGDGIRQYIRLWYPDTFSYPCIFSEEGWVDVVPGQLTDLGVIEFSFVDDVACPRMFSPTWSHDGSRILYLFREATTSIDPENNIWQISPQAAITSFGSRVLDMNNYVGRGKLYRAVFAPTAARADEFLFLQQEALEDLIFYATTENAPSHGRIDLGLCPDTACDVLDIVWLPDGSGFVIARQESGLRLDDGALYRFTFADRQLTEIVRLPGEAIGKLAVAPDGSAIVFERGPFLTGTTDKVYWGPTVQCPCAVVRKQRRQRPAATRRQRARAGMECDGAKRAAEP